MHKTHQKILVIVLPILFATIAGCGAKQPVEPTQSPDQLFTQVAATVQANITLTALAMPTNTNTPEPTMTLTPTMETILTSTPMGSGLPATNTPQSNDPGSPKIGDHAILGYQTPADNATFPIEQNFMLTFGFLNTGTTTWKKDTYSFRWFGGDKLWNETTFPMPKDIKPGEKAEFNLRIFVPDTPKKYLSRYGLYNAEGKMFYEVYYTFTAQ